MVADAMDEYDCAHEHADWTDMSAVAIDATAKWFEEVIELIGVQPSAIPALLHWQAHAHEYSLGGSPGSDEMDNEAV